VLTTNEFKDSQILPDLLKQIDVPIDQLSGDGGYDSHKTYDVIAALGTRPVIPP
jgi:Transposase DDE domain